MSMKFGEYLRKHRLAKGIQATALAQKVGISRPYLVQIESGTKEPPSEPILARLAEELDIPQKVMFRAANSELYSEEYLDETVDFGEIYRRLTVIEGKIQQMQKEGGNLTGKYLAQHNLRMLEEMKSVAEEAKEIQSRLDKLAKKPLAGKELPPKVKRIIEELLQTGERGQAYALKQIEVYREFLERA